jgi:peptide/nickel transport system permease protein
MWAYALRRCLWMLPMLVGVTFVCFLLLRAADADPVRNDHDGLRSNQVSPQAIAQLRQLYELDRPWYVQYAHLLRRVATLQLGNAWQDGRPIAEIIGEALPITLLLSSLAIGLSYLIAVPLGVYSALARHTRLDRIITLGLFVLYSLPAFWLGTLLLVFLASGKFISCPGLDQRACFPLQGWHVFDGFEHLSRWQQIKDVTWHLILPVATLSCPALAMISRYARAGMLDSMQQDYIRTAQAKGLSRRAVVLGHALRNSLIPVITLLGLELPELIGGSVVVEAIFGVRGMGLVALEAARMPDYPLMISIVGFSALLTMLGTLASDLVHAWLDPRLRAEAR